MPFAQQPLARPVIAQPKKRSTTSGRESTSSRDGHLWYAAMLRVGIDEATALEAVRERLDCSEAFAKQVVRQKAQRRASTSPEDVADRGRLREARVQLRARPPSGSGGCRPRDCSSSLPAGQASRGRAAASRSRELVAAANKTSEPRGEPLIAILGPRRASRGGRRTSSP